MWQILLDLVALREVVDHLVVHVPRNFEVEGIQRDDDGADVGVDDVFHVAALQAVEQRGVVENGEIEEIVDVFVENVIAGDEDVVVLEAGNGFLAVVRVGSAARTDFAIP